MRNLIHRPLCPVILSLKSGLDEAKTEWNSLEMVIRIIFEEQCATKKCCFFFVSTISRYFCLLKIALVWDSRNANQIVGICKGFTVVFFLERRWSGILLHDQEKKRMLWVANISQFVSRELRQRKSLALPPPPLHGSTCKAYCWAEHAVLRLPTQNRHGKEWTDIYLVFKWTPTLNEVILFSALCYSTGGVLERTGGTPWRGLFAAEMPPGTRNFAPSCALSVFFFNHDTEKLAGTVLESFHFHKRDICPVDKKPTPKTKITQGPPIVCR